MGISGDHTIAMTNGYYSSISTVFIDFETFKSQGSIPRNPDCESVCTQLEDIDRLMLKGTLTIQMNIEAEFKPTHDEHARQQFVSMLRKHAIINMTVEMHGRYENDVLPTLQKQKREPQDWRDIQSAMQDDPTYYQIR